MATSTVVATPPQTKLSKVLGVLFTVGTSAVSIFVKNANHQQTAENILDVLQQLLPTLEEMI